MAIKCVWGGGWGLCAPPPNTLDNGFIYVEGVIHWDPCLMSLPQAQPLAQHSVSQRVHWLPVFAPALKDSG